MPLVKHSISKKEIDQNVCRQQMIVTQWTVRWNKLKAGKKLGTGFAKMTAKEAHNILVSEQRILFYMKVTQATFESLDVDSIDVEI